IEQAIKRREKDRKVAGSVLDGMLGIFWYVEIEEDRYEIISFMGNPSTENTSNEDQDLVFEKDVIEYKHAHVDLWEEVQKKYPHLEVYGDDYWEVPRGRLYFERAETATPVGEFYVLIPPPFEYDLEFKRKVEEEFYLRLMKAHNWQPDPHYIPGKMI
ncbi:hypothetical protein ACFL35_21435, partial [Candidatus Riflebacteria bacterium]